MYLVLRGAAVEGKHEIVDRIASMRQNAVLRGSQTTPNCHAAGRYGENACVAVRQRASVSKCLRADIIELRGALVSANAISGNGLVHILRTGATAIWSCATALDWSA